MSVPVPSLAEASAGIAAGTLSPIALTEAALARIAALDPKLNAFITITADRARQAAATAEAEIKAEMPRPAWRLAKDSGAQERELRRPGP
jgi:Asp-tRNA(Asn)/Glu-tRNA(Gln) amidotransferase A subunit family amidase